MRAELLILASTGTYVVKGGAASSSCSTSRPNPLLREADVSAVKRDADQIHYLLVERLLAGWERRTSVSGDAT